MKWRRIFSAVILLWVVLVFWAAPSAAEFQQPVNTPPQSVRDLVRDGYRLWQADQIEQAWEAFERALPGARAESDKLAEAECIRGFGHLLIYKAQYAAARQKFEEALPIYASLSVRVGVGKVYHGLGFVEWMLGDHERALEYYRKSILEYEAVGDLKDKGLVMYYLAVAVGFGPEQTEMIQPALELARQTQDLQLEGFLWHLWGASDAYFGNYASAMDRLNQADVLLERAGNRIIRARTLVSLGRVYGAHGRSDEAMAAYRRALKIQEDVGDQQGLLGSLNIIASTMNDLGLNRQALDYSIRALTIAEKTASPVNVANQRFRVANAYLALGEFARAAELLQEIERGQTIPELQPLLYARMSAAYRGLRRNDEALNRAEKAVSSSRIAASPAHLVATLAERAKVKTRLGRAPEALEDTREALDTIERLRTQLVPSDFMKRGFADHYGELFGEAIDLLYRTGQPEQALEIAERGRARAFLDLLAAHDAADFQSAILTTLGTPSSTADTSAPAIGVRRELSSPASAAVPSMRQIHAVAARLNSTILTYWVNPDATYIWVVPPDGATRARRIAVSALRLRQLVQSTWPGVTPSPTKAALRVRGGDALVLDRSSAGAWEKLYQLLIEPVRNFLPKTPGSAVTVIPHGPLFQVSFAALRSPSGRYLLEDYALHYGASAAQLEFTEKARQGVAQQPRYLFIADPARMPAGPDGKTLPPLPGARNEVEAIARALPRSAVTLLSGAQATEDRLRSVAESHTVIHFATHGILRDDQPFESFLALSGGGLTAQEIYDIHLRADLIVLSACRTALGKVSGDGILGLTRAFFYAGTPSVIATLWDVADEPTAILLSEFYKALPRLKNKSKALREAQLKLLESLRRGGVHLQTPAGDLALPEFPVFWAGFVLQGEP